MFLIQNPVTGVDDWVLLIRTKTFKQTTAQPQQNGI